MKRKLLALIALLLAAPGVAVAAPNPTSSAFKSVGTLISAQTLAATRSFTLDAQDLQGYGLLAVTTNFTRSAATNVVMTCYASDDLGTTYFNLHSCAVSAGDCTSSPATWTYTTSTSKKWVWRVDVSGVNYLKCEFTGASGAAGDIITVKGYLTSP